MKTLYFRIVVTTILVMIFSGLVAFLLSNIFYHYNLKPYNDEKLTKIATDIKSYYEENPEINLNHYLKNVSELGYQILLVDENGKKTFYGGKFREQKLNEQVIKDVKNGEVYHGVLQFPFKLFVTGFFDNVLVNTIGTPLKGSHANYAIFLRPNLELQFGELHILFSVLLVLTIILSILFVFISTRYIVKPIRKLTEATKIIANGKYNVKLNIKRQDEIGQLAKHFSVMAGKLDQNERMRQEFVSNVSHEIQSPLASIQGFSQTLQQKELSDDQRKHYLSIIEEETRRMSLLSKQLLTLASLDKEENVLQKSTFDLAEQIKEALLTTEWSWREKDLMIDLELPSVYIYADKHLLHQVWTNLITNSIKFNHAGGEISIRIIKEEKECLVEIKDTGIGISKEDLPHIFNRFYIADKARIRKVSSSGLGLAITKQIIDLHNGQIQVNSQLGKGTTFMIQLPKM